MSGILGIMGEGSLAELQSMAQRMAYRGRHLHMSNPAPGVYLAEISRQAASTHTPSALYLDLNGPLYPPDCASAASAIVSDDGQRQRLESDLRQRGVAALRDVTGNFALAFWDQETSSVLLACDRQRFKTLHYARLPGRVAFATDYKALLALHDCPAAVDKDTLQTYLLLLSCPRGHSLLKNISTLPRATVLKVRATQITSEQFWVPHRRVAQLGFRDAARALRTTLETSLARQLTGRRRVALMLSGGLDSAALLALVRHVRPDIEVATYTIGHSAADTEIVRAREAAAHFHSEHHDHFFPLQQLATELPKLVWLTEDLSGREEALLQRMITIVAAARDSVIVAGHGADMVFAGMPRHRILWLHDRVPPPLRAAFSELYVYTRYKRMPRSWLGRKLVTLAYRSDLPEPPKVIGAESVIVNEAYQSLDRYLEQHNTSSSFPYHEPLHAQLGLTLLTPFLDPQVSEFALGCPGSYHIGLRAQKRLLRAAVEDLLPEFVLARGKAIQRLKRDTELSEAIDRFADELNLARSLADRGLIAFEYTTSLRTRSPDEAYTQERVHTLWAMICAELWLRQFIDQRGVAGC